MDAIFEYLEIFYTRQPCRSAPGMLTSAEYELKALVIRSVAKNYPS